MSRVSTPRGKLLLRNITIGLLSLLALFQVREQLKIKDLLGRSILTHAVMSGHEQLFEAALHALRDEVLDDEVRSAQWLTVVIYYFRPLDERCAR